MKRDHFANPMRVRQSRLQVGYHVDAITVASHLLTFEMLQVQFKLLFVMKRLQDLCEQSGACSSLVK
jgi:hypothetical protein